MARTKYIPGKEIATFHEDGIKEMFDDAVADLPQFEIDSYHELSTVLIAGLDKGALRDERPEEAYQGQIRCSAIGYCVRQQVIKFLDPGKIQPKDPDFIRMAKMGNAVGEDVIESFKAAGFEFEAEIAGTIDSKTYVISGHADGLGMLGLLFGGQVSEEVEKTLNPMSKMILEVKSMHQFPFGKTKEANRPRPADLIQSHLYAGMFAADTIVHVAINRNDGEPWLLVMPVIPTIQETALHRAAFVIDHTVKKTLPASNIPASFPSIFRRSSR